MILSCPITEARLLGAMLCEPDVLSWCDEIELYDFALWTHQEVLKALRNLQARGELVGPLEVFAEIERTDTLSDKHVADTVNAGFLGLLVCEAQYLEASGQTLAIWDIRYLRSLANNRRRVEQLARRAAECG